MAKKILVVLAVVDITFIAIMAALLTLVNLAVSKPLEIGSRTEVAIVTEKVPKTLSVIMDRGGARMVAISSQDFYSRAEIGDKIVLIDKKYQCLLSEGEPLNVLVFKDWDEYVAEAGAESAERLAKEQELRSNSIGPRAGIMNEIRP